MTPTTETWRPVVGHEGLYEVSDLGRVRSVDRDVAYPGGRMQRHRGRVLSPKRTDEGRKYVNLSRQGKARLYKVALLVLEAFVGPRPPGTFGCHSDGDASNDRVTNLRWDTPSANNYDRIAHGRDWHASRTHCIRGHLLLAPNLTAAKARQGHRNCLACDRAKHSGLRGAELAELADDHYARILRAA